jgi:hypothetical protein
MILRDGRMKRGHFAVVKVVVRRVYSDEKTRVKVHQGREATDRYSSTTWFILVGTQSKVIELLCTAGSSMIRGVVKTWTVVTSKDNPESNSVLSDRGMFSLISVLFWLLKGRRESR